MTDPTIAPASRPALTMTFGGGGAYALGFHLGVHRGLLDEGIDVSGMPLLGTSGGSYAAAAIATGLTFEDVAARWIPFSASAPRLWVKPFGLTEQLFPSGPGAGPTNVGAVAIEVRRLRRRILRADELGLAEIVAASSSLFPVARPFRIGRRFHVDGGHRSITSCDMAPPADLQIVLAAFDHPGQGLIGKSGRRQLHKEPGRWERRTGGVTLVVGTDDAIRAVPIRGLAAMGDAELGGRIHELARPIGRRLAGTLRSGHGGVLARSGADHGGRLSGAED